MLVRETKSHAETNANPIIAGPRPKQGGVKEASAVPLLSDPWANWQGSKPESDTSVSVRATPGPIDARLSAQDDKLKLLEQTVQQIQECQADQTTCLTHMKDAQQKSEHATKQYIDSRFQEFRSELD